MGFIPKNAKWYLADLVEEVRVAGERRNVVHTNWTLIRADSPEEAHKEAIALGKGGNTQYKNLDGKTVTIRFRGINELNVIHDELEHGAEIGFSENIGVSEKKIKGWIPLKRRLGVFAPMRPVEGPDYVSAEIMREIWERWPNLGGRHMTGRRSSESVDRYPPIWTMVLDAGTKSGSPMWWRSSFFCTTPRMKSARSLSEAPRRIWACRS